MGELELVYEKEQDTVRRSLAFLGETSMLLEEALRLYAVLGELVGDCGFGSVPAGEQKGEAAIHTNAAVFVKCLLACRYQLIAGSLAIMRGHLADSHGYTRKAIEFCAFALHCLECPQSATIWINAGSSKTAFQKYRSTFNIMKLLAQLKPRMGDLQERYEWLSTEVHGSYFALVKQVYPRQVEEGTLFHFAYCDVERDWNLLPSTVLSTVRTHFEIAQTLGKAAAIASTRFDINRWADTVAQFFQLYDNHRRQWDTPSTREIELS